MNRMMARSGFVAMAIGICTSAAFHWHEPQTQMFARTHGAPPMRLSAPPAAAPDQSLLLFIFSLTQGGQLER